MAAKPYYTSNALIEAVKRKIAFPVSQNTFTTADILAFANEEMSISQVPSVLEYHEEYFVYNKQVPLVPNISRYPIPNRAISMRLRDLFWSDSDNNLFEMSRISSEDKAFWARNVGSDTAISKYYLEGNDVVMAPSITGTPTGSLNFFIFLRPNQLVPDSRAAIIESFYQQITLTNASIVAGDTITITMAQNTNDSETYIFTAVAGAPAANQFQIGASSIATASNLVTAINTADIGITASNGTPVSAVVFFDTNDATIEVEVSNSTGFTLLDDQLGIKFDQLDTTWLNPDTGVTEDLYSVGALVDFLQTNPGHKTYNYDVEIQSMSGTRATFNQSDLYYYASNGFGSVQVALPLKVGDYICLQYECIIPQIPPDLHNGLAERTSARILASLGDMQGLTMAKEKIAEINASQGTLLDSRVEGSPAKITARHSLLRYGKFGVRRRT